MNCFAESPLSPPRCFAPLSMTLGEGAQHNPGEDREVRVGEGPERRLGHRLVYPKSILSP